MMMLCPDYEEKKGENQVDINRVTLVGRIGKDPEIQYTADGTGIARFSVATNTSKVKEGDKWVDGPPDWHRVVAWGKLADRCGFLGKGELVYVEGKLRTRSYDKEGEKRYITEVQAKNLFVLDSGASASNSRKDKSNVSVEDDVPF